MIPPIGANPSLDENTNVTNNAIRQINSMESVLIYKDDQGTRTVILDKNGLRTTAPGSGIDVVTASDSELTSNSANNVFKILDEGNATLTFSVADLAGPASRSVSMGNFEIVYDEVYDFVPIVMVFLTAGDSSYFPVVEGSTYASNISVNTTQLQFFTLQLGTGGFIVNYSQKLAIYNASNAGAQSGTLTFKYYVLQESAN